MNYQSIVKNSVYSSAVYKVYVVLSSVHTNLAYLAYIPLTLYSLCLIINNVVLFLY